MTTMDSDSESQDSDDGRRFRFEATRKDATVALQARKRKSPPRRINVDRRSRSRERADREKSSYDRSKHGHNKKDSRSGQDSRRDLRNREEDERHDKDSKHLKKSYPKDSRDAHDLSRRESKDFKSSSTYKESREKDSRIPGIRDSKSSKTRESKDSRDREHGKRRSQEKLRDRSRERSSADRHGSKYRDKHKRSKDRSREKSSQTNRDNKSSDYEKYRDERCKSLDKVSKRESRSKDLKLNAHSANKILKQIGGSDSDSNSGVLNPEAEPVPRSMDSNELNLSDFEVVSDAEGDSSDDSDCRSFKKSQIDKGQISPSRYDESRVKKRVSRQQYERLLKKQTARNQRHLEELHKVNPRNGDRLPGPSNSNPSAVSDSLLGSELSAAASMSVAIENAVGCARDRSECQKDRDLVSSSDVDEENLGYLLGSHLKVATIGVSTYGPALPPKLVENSNAHPCLFDSANERGTVSTSDKTDNACEHPNINRSPSSAHNGVAKDDLESVRSEQKRPRRSSLSLEESQNTYGPLEPDDITNEGQDTRSKAGTPRIIGPSLPPHLQNRTAKSEGDEEEDTFGPALPPHLLQTMKDNPDYRSTVFGPILPDGVQICDDNENCTRTSASEDDDNTMGPLPADHPAATSNFIQKHLEQRARRLRDEFRESVDNQGKKREEWMTELPSAQATTFGLGPRKFRLRPGPDMSDRSSWTDTPADKLRKQREKEEGKIALTEQLSVERSTREKEEEKEKGEVTEKRKSKKRQESLLEMHQKKKKKEEKKAKDAGKPVRRPFNRDIDLQVNRFDEARNKSIFMKAQLLDDRFSRGES